MAAQFGIVVPHYVSVSFGHFYTPKKSYELIVLKVFNKQTTVPNDAASSEKLRKSGSDRSPIA